MELTFKHRRDGYWELLCNCSIAGRQGNCKHIQAVGGVKDFSIHDCPQGATTLNELCEMIATGVHDIDIKDFQSRSGLKDGWDWNDVFVMIEDGKINANEIDDIIHRGLR